MKIILQYFKIKTESEETRKIDHESFSNVRHQKHHLMMCAQIILA